MMHELIERITHRCQHISHLAEFIAPVHGTRRNAIITIPQTLTEQHHMLQRLRDFTRVPDTREHQDDDGDNGHTQHD